MSRWLANFLLIYCACSSGRLLARGNTHSAVITLIQVLHVTKEELRAELERQAERYKDVYGGEVTTYAAQTEPERKPWRKRATVQDQAFNQELERMEKELRSEDSP